MSNPTTPTRPGRYDWVEYAMLHMHVAGSFDLVKAHLEATFMQDALLTEEEISALVNGALGVIYKALLEELCRLEKEHTFSATMQISSRMERAKKKVDA
jgi:hypothetical protein